MDLIDRIDALVEEKHLLRHPFYQAWLDGTGRLRTQEVLETAESSARQLAHAFKGRPDFKEIIGYDDGFCWLKVD